MSTTTCTTAIAAASPEAFSEPIELDAPEDSEREPGDQGEISDGGDGEEEESGEGESSETVRRQAVATLQQLVMEAWKCGSCNLWTHRSCQQHPEDMLRVRRNAADALYLLPTTTTTAAAAAAAAQGCTREPVVWSVALASASRVNK